MTEAFSAGIYTQTLIMHRRTFQSTLKARLICEGCTQIIADMQISPAKSEPPLSPPFIYLNITIINQRREFFISGLYPSQYCEPGLRSVCSRLGVVQESGHGGLDTGHHGQSSTSVNPLCSAGQILVELFRLEYLPCLFQPIS